MNIGFLYSATGTKHVREALHAAQSVRRLHPEAGCIIYTSEEDIAEHGTQLRETFTQVLPHPDPRRDFRDKIPPLIDSPFERTLFLDSDTELLMRVDDLFDLLTHYELLYCRDTTRYNMPATEVPPAFSEPNTGVLAIRKTPTTTALLQDWLTRYDSGHATWTAAGKPGTYHDQGPFRSALWASSVQHYCIAEEYNLRGYNRWYAGAAVRILHCREPQLSQLRRSINLTEGMRYGDGEGLIGRAKYELKQWLKKNLRGNPYYWENKEALNKTYP
jgi:hypothetical protein